MGKDKYFNVGDLVKIKSMEELKKFGIKEKNPANIPFMDDIGIVVQVSDLGDKTSSVRVRWQKLNEEYSHFVYTLDKISSVS